MKLHIFKLAILSLFPLLATQQLLAQKASKDGISNTWVADQGDGTYKNPILHADYSDPDAVRVGDDFYMTASSFTCSPSLPILHSKDLVNWELVNYALPKQPPFEFFEKAQHGKGVWAPCIRYHEGEYYIYYPDPDFGIYMIKTKDPEGAWSEPVLVKGGKGFIDPSPLWDDDGNVYLVHAFAGSRASIKSLIVVCKMNKEGTKTIDDGVMVFDGHGDNPTVEGPKFYKRNGYYYIFAPAGGVPTGWQLVMRSKNIYGPYESKNVLATGNTDINGPHQGAWVSLESGEDWFLHFQDKGAYGRIVHLQPMKWINDWPVMGNDADGDGTGEPVLTYKKPDVGKTYPIVTPPESDEFNKPNLGLQWQWNAIPQPYWAFPTSMGYLRLFSYPLPEDFQNFWDVPNLLLQKFPAPEFTATAKITFNPRFEDEKAGLIIFGRDYSYISVKNDDDGLEISQTICENADKNGKEVNSDNLDIESNTFYLRVEVTIDAICRFSFSENGKRFKELGKPFKAREGGWVGAKVGLFCVREGVTNDSGNIDVDWFRVTK
ncbi:MAG: glycoside hydrolase [Thalassobius sp.]|nr:glycoside hydrolase [Thalassovita sp.]